MGIKKSGVVGWAKTLLLASFVFMFRMYIHYIGQWLWLKVEQCPVTISGFTWYEIKMEYSYWLMTQ